MPTAKVTSKGQVTIPRKIRELLRLKPGDQLEFIMDAEGKVTVRAGTLDVRDLKGLLHRPGRRAVSLEKMDAAILRRHKKSP